MTRRDEGRPQAAAAAASRMAHRIPPRGRARLQRLDLMLVAAMLVVTVSYALGYRLDWNQEQGLSLGTVAEEEEETLGAQVPAPASAVAVPPIAPAAGPAAALAPAPTLAPAPAQAVIAPAAPSAWAQDAERSEWDRMTEELASNAARHPGRVSIVLKDLRTQRSWSYHPDDLFPAASLIKVPVMIAAFYKISAGELSLKDRLMLRRQTRVGGSGSLKWRPDGTRLTVEELLIHMINESDNTATAMMIDALGLGYVQQQFPRMGLLYTGIYPEGMSIKGGRVAHENYTTAREMTMLLESIYRGEAVDKYSSSVMLDILKKPKAVASRLAKGLPVGWEIAHKTGLLRMACHDSAIFFTPHGDYAMTVLTGQNRSYQEAKDFITHLGHVTFRYYTGADRLARRMHRNRQLASRSAS
jgi:beta-lactamase class A